MCRRASTTLPRDPQSVGRARRWLRVELTLLYGQLDALASDVEVVASELVTNAMRAGSGSVELELEGHHSRVTVAVTDNAPGLPVVGHPAPDRAGGRGLHIVDALAQQWGVVVEGSRKTVWADLAVPGSAQLTFACADPGRADRSGTER